MLFINPTINGFTPDFNFVTDENKIHRWGDYEIELPTDGWCRLPFDAANKEDQNGVLIGLRNQYWTETFFIVRMDIKQDDILYKAAAKTCKNPIEFKEKEKFYRADKLFVPENEKLIQKGSFIVDKKLFDFMLTSGNYSDIIKRRYFCMCYPDGNWMGPSFFVEHTLLLQNASRWMSRFELRELRVKALCHHASL
jgi:hypothetical protein